MKSSEQWTSGMIAAAIIVSGAAAFAAPQGPGDINPEGRGHAPGTECRQGPPPQGPFPMLPSIERLKDLGATDQQIQALKEAAYEQDKQMVTLRANLERAEIELRHLMDAPAVDKKAVTETVDTINAARGELFKAEILNMLKVRETLGEKLFRQLQQPPRQVAPTDRPQPPARLQGRGGPGQAGGDQGGPDRAPGRDALRGDRPADRP